MEERMKEEQQKDLSSEGEKGKHLQGCGRIVILESEDSVLRRYHLLRETWSERDIEVVWSLPEERRVRCTQSGSNGSESSKDGKYYVVVIFFRKTGLLKKNQASSTRARLARQANRAGPNRHGFFRGCHLKISTRPYLRAVRVSPQDRDQITSPTFNLYSYLYMIRQQDWYTFQYLSFYFIFNFFFMFLLKFWFSSIIGISCFVQFYLHPNTRHLAHTIVVFH